MYIMGYEKGLKSFGGVIVGYTVLYKCHNGMKWGFSKWDIPQVTICFNTKRVIRDLDENRGYPIGLETSICHRVIEWNKESLDVPLDYMESQWDDNGIISQRVELCWDDNGTSEWNMTEIII